MCLHGIRANLFRPRSLITSHVPQGHVVFPGWLPDGSVGVLVQPLPSNTQYAGAINGGCLICFLTDRCYCTYTYLKHNSHLAKLRPSQARWWGKHRSSNSQHIAHLFCHNNCGKYKYIRELGEGSSSFYCPATSSAFLLKLLMLSGWEGERVEKGVRPSTSFPRLLFIHCFFL